MTENANANTTVLVAGATGMLGGRIAAELLNLPRWTCAFWSERPRHDSEKAARL